MRTQKEINYYLQDTTIKNARNLLDIELCIRNNNLHLPNNVIIHENGISFAEFYKWFENRNKIPTTYEECCKIIEDVADASLTCFACNLLNNFQKLLLCRDAYWEIAGEQMGLNELWEPDWTDLDQLKYCIWVDVGEFITMINVRGQHILAFPTEEMRDAFYENFNDLIEQCKELL